MTNNRSKIYQIISEEKIDGGFISVVALDQNHAIYQAHFQDNPITPGVVLLQICKELVESRLSTSLALYKVNNVKFIKAISPIEYPTIEFHYSISKIEGGYRINCIIKSKETQFVKATIKLKE